jgi:hypothetical protein
VAIPRDIDVIFGIISKTNVARFGKENSRKYFISVPISLGNAPVSGLGKNFLNRCKFSLKKTSLSTNDAKICWSI